MHNYLIHWNRHVIQEHLGERSLLPTTDDYICGGKLYPVDSHPRMDLPQTITVQNKNNVSEYLLDYATQEEIPDVLGIYHQAITEGYGVSWSDVPTSEVLKEIIKNPHPYHLVVIKTKGQIIGITTSAPSEYLRTSAPKLSDGIAILKPEYQNCGMGFNFLCLLSKLNVKIGYIGSLGDCFACNPASYVFLGKVRGQIVGRVPYAGRAGTNGWTDTILTLTWGDDVIRLGNSKL